MLKRGFDILASGFLLGVLSPLFLAVALLVKVDSWGPVFHRAIRVGRYRKPFTLYKFRSMVTEAPRHGPGITRRGDPRITRVGRFLREWKIDEVPQLVNVLRGDMSMVGPRPEDPRYVALYTEDQLRVLSVRPGIVSPASVKYRHEEQLLATASDLEAFYVDVVLPDKLRIDLDYVERYSLFLDLAVLGRTALSLFSPAFTRTTRPG